MNHRNAALVVLLAGLWLVPACSRKPSRAPGPAPAGSIAGVPIDNFAKVSEGVYRGAQPDAAGFKALQAMGVKTIVNLRGKHDDRPEATPLGLAGVDHGARVRNQYQDHRPERCATSGHGVPTNAAPSSIQRMSITFSSAVSWGEPCGGQGLSKARGASRSRPRMRSTRCDARPRYPSAST